MGNTLICFRLIHLKYTTGIKTECAIIETRDFALIDLKITTNIVAGLPSILAFMMAISTSPKRLLSFLPCLLATYPRLRLLSTWIIHPYRWWRRRIDIPGWMIFRIVAVLLERNVKIFVTNVKHSLNVCVYRRELGRQSGIPFRGSFSASIKFSL